MAFISMVFATIFVCFILIGWLLLLIGLILHIIWYMKKRKDKEVKRSLKICARVFTVWGLIQGIGPIVLIAAIMLFNS